MTYPYNNRGVPLTDLFDPDVIGDGPVAANYKVAGVPLRFAHIKYGSKRANVGYAQDNVDVSNLWAAKGTARYALPIDGMTFTAFSSGSVSSGMLAKVTVSINTSGGFTVVCEGNSAATTTQLGDWLPSGQPASGYQVRFTVTQQSQSESGPATFTNSAPSYVTCAANQTVSGSASVGQLSAQAKGGSYTIVIALKKISTGTVTTTTIFADIDSVGTG
jgi:hypothetical protein